MSNVIPIWCKATPGELNRLLRMLRELRGEYPPPKDFTAVLETRDGCTKTIRFPYPPKHSVKTALMPDPSFSVVGDECASFSVVRCREYELSGYGEGLSGELFCRYLEKDGSK